jgi:LPS-assembly protein
MAGTRLIDADGSGRRRPWLAAGRAVAVFGSMAAMMAAGSLMDPTSAVTRSEQAGHVGNVGHAGQTAGKSDRLRPELKTPPRGTPVDVAADRITYDADADVAVATGQVVITYGNYVLEAREVVYDRRNDRLRADGEIRLIEPGGNVLEANVAELWNRMRDGFATHLRLLLTNDATITAQYARRSDGVVTVYTAVTYTRCKTCVTPEGAPLWQIRSAEVTHDEEEGVIYHRDASFEFLGRTVFWLPYLSHPDPTVSRRSGFLLPIFRYSSLFGLGVEVPYFWELAPNYDITFRPLLTTQQGPLLRAEWRHRLARGAYSVDAGGIYQLDRDVRPPGDRRWRGFARTRGDFHINQNWTWGWDATVFSDDTFMRRYRIDNRTEVVSLAHLTGLSGRNYFTAQTLHFQGLLPDDVNKTFPYVLPYIRHDYTLDRPVLGGEFGIDTNVYSLIRDDPSMPFPTVEQARRQSRAVVDAHWQRRMVGAMGQVVTPFARLRGDVYVTEDLPDVTDPAGLRDEEITARMLPTAGVDLRWPFMRSDGLGTHVVTPVAQIISSANEVRRDRIGNEDAIQVNFDHTGLFLHDRFMGEDRFEGGTRANLGLLYTMLLPTGGFARASFGQSVHIAGKNSFAPESGLASTRSDLVGALALQPFENLRFSYQLRLDEDTFDVHTQEIGLNANFWGLSTTLNYAAIGAEPAHGRPFDQEQIWGAAEYALGGGWSVLGAARYDLETNRLVRSQIGLGFDCDCFRLQVFYRHDNTTDRDVREDHSVLLSVEFKTLGSARIAGGF